MIDISAVIGPLGNVVGEYRPARPAQTKGCGSETSDKSDAVVLIVDDCESDRFLLIRAFSAATVKNPIRIVTSGEDAIRYLSGEGRYSDRTAYPLPKIVFLDLKMPAPCGLDVLRWKRTRTDLPRILWIAMSAVISIKSIDQAYKAGADTFLAKPLHPPDIKNLIDSFDDFWLLNRAT